MKKTFLTLTFIVALSLAFNACNNPAPASDEAAKIENTLQSVSYFKDTSNIDPQVLKDNFTAVNDAIAEIGYPDAG